MGYAVYKVGKRWGGYGVPAVCEYPDCKVKIDRGVSYACGGEPFSEHGCDRYFCDKHRDYIAFKDNGEECNHVKDCKCESVQICERCRDGELPFPYKPEVIRWIKHILKDKSWKEWRDKNPAEVEEYKKYVKETTRGTALVN